MSAALPIVQKDGYEYLMMEYVNITVSVVVLLYILLDLQHHPFRWIDLLNVLVFVYIIVRNGMSANNKKMNLSNLELWITAGAIFLLTAFGSRISLFQRSVF